MSIYSDFQNRKGLSLRKRFRATTRHAKGKGLVISIQTIAGHTLFACTVGDLGHSSGIGDVSMDSWSCIEGMVNVVRRTGHSSYYVEKGMSAMGKTPKQMGIQGDFRVNGGGVFRSQNLFLLAMLIIEHHSFSCLARGEALSGCDLKTNLSLRPKSAPCCPIAVVACYSGSSQEDHNVRSERHLQGLLLIMYSARSNHCPRLPEQGCEE